MTTSPAASAPESRTFTTIGVIGLGTMGAGIAEVFARHGYAVVGVEKDADALDRGRQYLEHSTTRAVKKEKLTEAEQAELLGRIAFSTSLDDVASADLVVEAVVESLETKKALFRQLDAIVGPRRSSRRTPRASPSPRSPPRTPRPGGSSGCTSSTRRRCSSWSRSCAPW